MARHRWPRRPRLVVRTGICSPPRHASSVAHGAPPPLAARRIRRSHACRHGVCLLGMSSDASHLQDAFAILAPNAAHSIGSAACLRRLSSLLRTVSRGASMRSLLIYFICTKQRLHIQNSQHRPSATCQQPPLMVLPCAQRVRRTLLSAMWSLYCR